jgi:hypothetical protein
MSIIFLNDIFKAIETDDFQNVYSKILKLDIHEFNQLPEFDEVTNTYTYKYKYESNIFLKISVHKVFAKNVYSIYIQYNDEQQWLTDVLDIDLSQENPFKRYGKYAYIRLNVNYNSFRKDDLDSSTDQLIMQNKILIETIVDSLNTSSKNNIINTYQLFDKNLIFGLDELEFISSIPALNIFTFEYNKNPLTQIVIAVKDGYNELYLKSYNTELNIFQWVWLTNIPFFIFKKELVYIPLTNTLNENVDAWDMYHNSALNIFNQYETNTAITLEKDKLNNPTIKNDVASVFNSIYAYKQTNKLNLIDITNILSHEDLGKIFYLEGYGNVTLKNYGDVWIICEYNNEMIYLDRYGRFVSEDPTEPVAFFINENKPDWSTYKLTKSNNKQASSNQQTGDFKPFDKVLVRHTINEKWKIDIFERIYFDNCYVCLTGTYYYCIPYNEKTADLLGTTNIK